MNPQEIQRLEELCIQDDDPYCQAACPLHVDVRAMAEAIRSGDFGRAAKIYQKRVPLPGVLSRICDQPCRSACKRTEVGEAIAIQLLERSCADVVGFSSQAPLRPPLKQHPVAVVGAGLCGMTAALELAKKGYPVTLFEAEKVLGGRLRCLSEDLLPSKTIDEAVALLVEQGVDLRLGVRVGREVGLAELRRAFAAVCVSTGLPGITRLGSHGTDMSTVDQVAPSDPDPVTLSTDRHGVFAAGSMRRSDERYSPVGSTSDGCRAAVSIERLLKNESLTVHRGNEGARATRLYTSIEGVEPTDAVPLTDGAVGYDEEQAMREAARCLHCECMECVKACTYLEHFKEYPGKCIRKVTKNIVSVPGKSYRTYTPFLNACSLCGLCGAVCPTGVDMGVVNREARRIMVEQEFMPMAVHDFAIRDMESTLSERYAIARNQPGFESSRYLFFPGCQLVAAAPAHVQATYRYLKDRLPGGVGFVSRCCGAPAAWSGRRDLFREICDAFVGHWEGMGRPKVIAACPTCLLMLRDSLPEVPVVSLWEVIDRAGLPGGVVTGGGRRLAIHDSCTARGDVEVQDSVRRIVVAAGYEVVELAYSRALTKCCGYGGLMYEVDPGLTEKVILSRIEESDADYLTYCANCRDFFAGKGKSAYHVLDLLFGGPIAARSPGPGPTLSQRRDNRREMAERMLTGLWGDDMPELEEHRSIRLRISPQVAEKMDKEFILAEDVQQVIHRAEMSGERLLLPSTGHFVAHHRPAIITYWVEYAPEDGEYVIFNAYSHRMQIVKEGC